MRTPFAFVALATLASLSPVAIAQNATTTPVGVVSVQLDANRKTAISIPLEKAAVAVGTVSSVSASSLTDASASFGTYANSHFVRVLSGNATGRILRVTSNNATTITLHTGSGSCLLPLDSSSSNNVNIAVGDRFEVVPMWTLGEIFGTNAANCVLRTASNPNNADQIAIYTDGGLITVFNNGTNWRNALSSLDTANYNTQGLLPTAGLWITRRPGGSNAVLQFIGNVPRVAPRYQLPGGARVVVSAPLSAGVTLENLSFGNMTAWVRNNNPNNADQVTAYRPDGSVSTFFLNNSGVWRNALSSLDSTNYATVALPSGTGLWINRRGSASGFTANVKSVLPYHLE